MAEPARIHALVAQLDLERWSTKPKVAGSSPAGGTLYFVRPVSVMDSTIASEAFSVGSSPMRDINFLG